MKYSATSSINDSASTLSMNEDDPTVATEARALLNKSFNGAHASMVNTEPNYAKC